MKTTRTVAIGMTIPPDVSEEYNFALMTAIGLAKLDHKVLYLDLSASKKKASSPTKTRSELSLRNFLDGTHCLNELIFESPLGIHVISTNFCKKSLLKATPIELTNLIESFDKINTSFDFLILNFPDKPTASSIAMFDACHIQIMSIEPTSKSITKAYKLLQQLNDLSHANDVYLLPTSVPSISYGWKLFQRFNEVLITSINIHAKYLASLKSMPKMNIFQLKEKLPTNLGNHQPMLDLIRKIEAIGFNTSQTAHKFFEFQNLTSANFDQLNPQ